MPRATQTSALSASFISDEAFAKIEQLAISLIPDLELDVHDSQSFWVGDHTVTVTLEGEHDGHEWHQRYEIQLNGESIPYEQTQHIACQQLYDCAVDGDCTSVPFKIAVAVVVGCHVLQKHIDDVEVH